MSNDDRDGPGGPGGGEGVPEAAGKPVARPPAPKRTMILGAVSVAPGELPPDLAAAGTRPAALPAGTGAGVRPPAGTVIGGARPAPRPAAGVAPAAPRAAEPRAATSAPAVTRAPAAASAPPLTRAPAATSASAPTRAPAAASAPPLTRAPAATSASAPTRAPAATAAPQAARPQAAPRPQGAPRSPAAASSPPAAAAPPRAGTPAPGGHRPSAATQIAVGMPTPAPAANPAAAPALAVGTGVTPGARPHAATVLGGPAARPARPSAASPLPTPSPASSFDDEETALSGGPALPALGDEAALQVGAAGSAAEASPALPEEPPAPVTFAPRPQQDPITAGMRIKQYELIRELGRGGMGQVFLARDTKLGRLVAMKFLTGASEQFTERFIIEARTTAQVSHENIVIIHEVDEHQGSPYMVLEFLEGSPLSGLVEAQGKIPAARAVEIMVSVARALVRAHDGGIVHRDLKPDNIFVMRSGTIKVLDFGIAKLFSDKAPAAGGAAGAAGAAAAAGGELRPSRMTMAGALVGTLPYMSPEQLGADAVDHRTDLWAFGIILWELLTGRHPIDPLTTDRLFDMAIMIDEPMPSVLETAPELPERLAQLIDRCLRKHKAERYASAQELLQDLETLLPGRYGRQLSDDESPYPGLTAFQESDADRFFGRGPDVARAVARLREAPLIAIAGPSGVGKSSFVRAGMVPALRASGESWEIFIVRPGRNPLAGLASLLQPLTTGLTTETSARMMDHETLCRRLREEPGTLGTLLRSRARQKGTRILLFVDQLEELYTLVPEAAERAAFTACLAGVADDPATPLRVVVSVRSDFVDRAAEDRKFLDELTRGLVFLQPLGRQGLREALVQPVEMRGYRFETPAMVDQMLAALEATPGALPLLQFAAAKLWESRDRSHRLLTEASYQAMGGIAGALAVHANEVVSALPPPSQKLVRSVFQRLVTPERTRAIVDVTELRDLSADREEIGRLINHLVQARLLVVQTREDEGAAVEIVHESLITSWPALRRWLDEGAEDQAFLSQLRSASKQWEQRGRAGGLLWRGEAMEEARHWFSRYKGELAGRERDYLHAVFALANRATRIKRTLVVGTITFLALLVAAAAAALVQIRDAEQKARHQAVVAKEEAERARAAEKTVSEQLEEIKAKERARLAAEQKADSASAAEALSREELAAANVKLQAALAEAQGAKDLAEKEAERAKDAMKRAQELADADRRAKESTERLLAIEKARVDKLEKERAKISTDLK